MIRTLFRISWLNLKRDRVALVLTYVLPIGFFSIFAMIFGGMGGGSGSGGGPSAVRVLIVDEDQTTISARLVTALRAQDGLDVRTEDGAEPPVPYDRERAVSLVRTGSAPATLIIPAGFGASFGDFSGEGVAVDLVYDAANPIAQFTVFGLLQAASFQAAPDVLMEKGLESLEQFGGGPLTDLQRRAIAQVMSLLESDLDEDAADDDGGDADSAGTGTQALISVNATPAQQAPEDDGEDDSGPDLVSYYAAGIGVMFLLFSMVGAAGALLEEEETGTLERLLTSQVTMRTLLLSNWVFFSIIGVVQMVLMFVWGSVVFGLDLSGIPTLAGFTVMTLATSAAAAAFGMLLATLCRSRAQLSGISTIVILTMSALGGSMVPRFVASFLERTSPFTFNGWALEGYQRVFWYRQPDETVLDVLTSIAGPVGVLVAAAVIFLAIARIGARRWECA